MKERKERLREREQEKRREEREDQVRRQKLYVLAGILLVLSISAAAFLIKGCGDRKAKNPGQAAQQASSQSSSLDETLTLLAAGDNLFHGPLIETGKQKSGGWNYDSIYAHVKDKIQAADLAVVNQETVFVKDRSELSGYPLFGTPTEVGDALVNAGFDVIQQASNHTYDKKEQGVLDTLDFWRDNHPGIAVLGIHSSKKDQEKITVVEKKGIKIAMLNYTYGVNDNNLPSSKSYLIDIWDETRVENDIKQAEKEGDITVCFLHAGEEYSKKPTKDMEKKVDFLLQHGVDITIGAHPHVLQGYEMKKDRKGHQMLVYYSLGNFVSTQQRPEALLGGLAEITLVKSAEDGSVSIRDDYGLTPIVMQYDDDPSARAVYLLEDYTEEMAQKHRIHVYSNEEFTLKRLQEMAGEITGNVYS
ncbi:CapA family protein [Lactonifactor longoviformis]|uniref:CapA family protein n=1 Tax=Lactonifactor longoviformis TaxID=341220 RepID=UPI001D01B39E|nr:CapA family protein [Lactonifactor longoviformis]MCB5712569.1 CapA family protein [Lactonifactor longoviformis]MCB5716612.1 CapA family protein [Lactonifactor longoviformis]